MVSEPTDLRAMAQQVNQWMSEKPAFNSDGLSFQKDDVVFFNFVANGDDGDRFIKVYKAHIIPALSKNNKAYNETRFCTAHNGENENCDYCTQGLNDIKERMSMWLYVRNWLHAQQPREKNFPAVPLEGKIYFNEEINGWRNWETSAWRESPWGDICRLAEMYKGLHNFTSRMDTVGDGLTRRFKLYAMPNSDRFPEELYEQAKEECQPIKELLKSKLASAVQARPAGNQGNQQQATPQFVVGATTLPSFMGGGSPANPSAPNWGNPASAQDTKETPADVSGFTPPEGDQKRPMKSLF